MFQIQGLPPLPLQVPPDSADISEDNMDLPRESIPPFLKSLLLMLNTEDISIIRWLPCGEAFEIVDADVLAEKVIPRYFRHVKYASFQRQLNYFGFKKWSKSKTNFITYSQPFFLNGHPELMFCIRRKVGKGMPSPSSSTSDPTSDIRPTPSPPSKCKICQSGSTRVVHPLSAEKAVRKKRKDLPLSIGNAKEAVVKSTPPPTAILNSPRICISPSYKDFYSDSDESTACSLLLKEDDDEYPIVEIPSFDVPATNFDWQAVEEPEPFVGDISTEDFMQDAEWIDGLDCLGSPKNKRMKLEEVACAGLDLYDNCDENSLKDDSFKSSLDLGNLINETDTPLLERSFSWTRTRLDANVSHRGISTA